MKTILIFSDSHGDVASMEQAVEDNDADMIIHLGDCWNDARELKECFLDIPLEAVPGNCDCVMEPAQRILIIEGKRIMICHGHAYNVKSSLLALECAAREAQVDMVLFGHTHKVFFDWHNGLRMYNPGSIGAPGYNVPASYGILTIDGEADDIHVETIYME